MTPANVHLYSKQIAFRVYCPWIEEAWNTYIQGTDFVQSLIWKFVPWIRHFKFSLRQIVTLDIKIQKYNLQ